MSFEKYILYYLALLITLTPPIAYAQISSTEKSAKIVSLKYISPEEITQNLTLQKYLNNDNELMIDTYRVKLMMNNATNQIMLTGNDTGIAHAIQLIEFLDVPPRQIIIEAKIVEINSSKMNEMGMDWQNMLDNTTLDPNVYYNRTINERKVNDLTEKNEQNIYGFHGGAFLYYVHAGDLLKIIQDKGFGKIVSVPKIVTINNKKGTILDGSRITYITRYSGYSNVYETQEMSAGLLLEVTPSLGEGGYLKLIVAAKLTTLGEIVSGSPSETGQILENTVIVKDGQEFLLGGFKKTEKIKLKRKVPILGTILPFLFSRTTDSETNRDFLIILKPTVVDLNPMEIPEIK